MRKVERHPLPLGAGRRLVDWTEMRSIALLLGGAYVAVGFLGMIPPAHATWPDDAPPLTVRNGYGYLLGILPNNLPLLAVHLATGTWGIVASRRIKTAGLFLRAIAGFYATVAVLGLIPGARTLFGVMPLFGANVWLHAATGLVAFATLRLARPSLAARIPKGSPPAAVRPDRRQTGLLSTAAIAGHPIHPMLVPFPIAFLVGVLGTDLAYWWTTRPGYNGTVEFWPQASQWLLGAGFVTGLLAAVIGLIDYTTVRQARQPIAGRLHVSGSVMVLALALAGLLLRRDDAASAILPWGIALSAVTTALLAATVWFGGELVYRHLRPNPEPRTSDGDGR